MHGKKLSGKSNTRLSCNITLSSGSSCLDTSICCFCCFYIYFFKKTNSIFRAVIFILAFVLLLIHPAGMWKSKTTTTVNHCTESGLFLLYEAKGHALWLLSGTAAIRHRWWQQCLWALSSDTLTSVFLCCYPVK